MVVKTDYTKEDVLNIVKNNANFDLKDFKKWFSERYDKYGLVFHPAFITNLYKIKNILKQDKDFIIVVDGPERFGKSTLAFNFVNYLNMGFDVDNVWFDLKKFEEILHNSSKSEATLCTEAGHIFFSRRAMSSLNIEGVKIAQKMGYKNLLHTLCMPSIYDLDGYFKFHRIDLLIHIRYRTKTMVFFDLYFNNRIKDDNRITELVYMGMNKGRSYKYGKPQVKYLWARPTMKGMTKAYKELKRIEESYKDQKTYDKKYTISELVNETGISRRTFTRWAKSGKIKTDYQAGRHYLTKEEYKKAVSLAKE